MASYDPNSIRVRDGWVLALMDERKEVLASGIILPGSETGVEKVTEGVATLIKVGRGEKNHKIGLELGMRVCIRGFLKFANPIPTEETWPSGKPKEYFVMSSDDVMAIVPPGVSVGVFSSPSQSAVKSVSEDGKVEMK